MPWAHGDDYMEVKNAELKHLLELRGLPHSGNKVKMASRLRKHDHDQSVYRLTDTLTDAEHLLICRTVPFRSGVSRVRFAT